MAWLLPQFYFLPLNEFLPKRYLLPIIYFLQRNTSHREIIP